MAAYEEGVNERRQKLRELVLREEVGLIREVVDQAQHGDDERMEEMRRKTEDLKEQQEKERLAVVAAKRMQQYIARCPEFREKLWKKTAHEVKSSNLIQMADNEAKRRTEKELDELWHRLMLKEIEMKKERDVEEAKKREVMDKEIMATLANQVAGKLALEEERKRIRQEERENLERLWEKLRQEELENLERERINRENLKKDLQEQILTAKRRLAERSRREEELDKLYRSIAAEELAREKSGIQESSEALRRELLAYMHYMEDIRKEEARRNREVDAIVQQSMKDAEARRDLAVKKFKEARQMGLREVIRGREEQLRVKREMEREELERLQAERESFQKEIELEAKLHCLAKQETKEKMLRYGRELDQQKKQMEEKRRQEVEEEERYLQEQRRKDEEDQRLTDELLVASETITPHPFKILLEQAAARYAAEKEGRCYCPPPLPPE